MTTNVYCTCKPLSSQMNVVWQAYEDILNGQVSYDRLMFPRLKAALRNVMRESAVNACCKVHAAALDNIPAAC